MAKWESSQQSNCELRAPGPPPWAKVRNAYSGAVNTLTFRDGRIRGDNTDWIGFSWMIERQIGTAAGAVVAQVGAGGAGSATAFALARLGLRVLALYDHSSERCEALVARLFTGLEPDRERMLASLELRDA